MTAARSDLVRQAVSEWHTDLDLSADPFALIPTHNAFGGSREDWVARFDRSNVRYAAVYGESEFHEGEALT